MARAVGGIFCCKLLPMRRKITMRFYQSSNAIYDFKI